MLPACSAMADEHKTQSSAEVKDEELDDLSTFDAHSWALDHLKVEIKDEPKDEASGAIVQPSSSDVEDWSFDADGPPSALKPGGDGVAGSEEGGSSAAEVEALVPKEEVKTESRKERKERKRRKRKAKTDQANTEGEEGAEGDGDGPKWRVHRRRHSNELWVTVITNHNQKPKRKFTCQECHKEFGTKGNLNHHMRSHSGEQPFVCQVCGRRFSFNCNLNTHLLTHSGTKPFKCDVCEKSFVTKGNLITHSRTHTGEKPFECPHCGKGFSVKDNLCRHLKTHQEKPDKADKSEKSEQVRQPAEPAEPDFPLS